MTKIEEIKDTFELLDDWEDRYGYLIDLGRQLPEFPDVQKTDANIVKGCTSQVWMILSVDNDRLSIQASSDADIVRGLIAIVMVERVKLIQ